MRCSTPGCAGTLYCFMYDGSMVDSLLYEETWEIFSHVGKRTISPGQRKVLLELIGMFIHHHGGLKHWRSVEATLAQVHEDWAKDTRTQGAATFRSRLPGRSSIVGHVRRGS